MEKKKLLQKRTVFEIPVTESAKNTPSDYGYHNHFLQEDVIMVMKRLGNTYSNIAEKEKNVERAKSSFYMALKAYELALKTEKQMKLELREESPLGLQNEFLKKIACGTKRSAVWKMYLDFCQHHGLIAISKGQLFEKLQEQGFKTKTLDGYKILDTPRGKRKYPLPGNRSEQE